jgi:cytidylate kinase
MIGVITIDREYASGGAAIAARLASQRHWELWDQALSSEIAKLAKCEQSVVEMREERNDSLYYRLMKSFVRGSFEGNMNTQKLELLDADVMVQLTKKIVRRVAAKGNCVIVGRGSAYFLQDLPNAFHVFVYSTREQKMRRLRREGKSGLEAAHLIDTIDHDRAAFIRRYYGKCWPDRYLFHMMLNGTGGEDAAVDTINAAVATYDAHHPAGSITTQAAESGKAPEVGAAVQFK